MPRWTQQDYDAWMRKRATGVGAVDRGQREQDPQPALEQKPQAQPNSSPRLDYRVQIISCRNRLCDGDNSGSGGNKALRDAISDWLGIDDGSSRLQFEYAQLHTSGEEGTIVRIQKL